MSWYSARLLYERLLDSPARGVHPLFEESIVVFQADDDGETVPAKLKQLAEQSEVEYEAAAGNHVRWAFREVLEVQEISTDKGLVDGTEVYFRWWDKPGPRAFKMMRKTHREPWWLDEPTHPGNHVAGDDKRGVRRLVDPSNGF